MALFFDMFNLGNRVNLDGLVGNRRSGNFLQSNNALLPRQGQVGFRFMF